MSVGLLYQVAVDDHAHGQAGTLRKRRLDAQVASSHLLANLVHRVLQAVASGDDHLVAVAAVRRGRQFGTDPQ
ncbi:hypothetical protein D3C77_578660 [compost metagenome]